MFVLSSLRRPSAPVACVRALLPAKDAPVNPPLPVVIVSNGSVLRLIVAHSASDSHPASSSAGQYIPVELPLNAFITALFVLKAKRFPFLPLDGSHDKVLLLSAKCQWSLLDISLTETLSANAVPATDTTTIASGSFANPTASPPAEGLQLSAFDPRTNTVAVHAFQGLLNIFSPSQKKKSIALNSATVRIKELVILDITFLKQTSSRRPVLAVLHATIPGNRSIAFYEVDAANAELIPTTFGMRSTLEVSLTARSIFAVADSGILVFNDDGITHIEKTGSIRFEIETSSICPGVCMALGDSETVLLTDSIGSVFVLQLGDSRLSKIGETSPASTIAVLDDTTVYIGSSSGESCLIELDELVTPKSFAVLETFPNAAPIFDFIYTDGTSYLGSNTIESNGLPGAKISGTVQRGRAIACCGTGAQGSLQVLSNGIGMVEIFEMEDVSGVQGLWAGASDGSSAGSDDLLVVSFVGETRVLQFVEDGCNELDADDCLGLALDEETLVFGNVEFDQLVQITPSRVTLLRSVDRLKLDEWVAPANKRITLGTFNSSQILVAAGGNELLFFEIQEGSLALKGQVQTESQASCIDISSPTDMTMANFAALGTWGDSKVRILQLPSMRVVFEDDSAAAEPQLPRSVKFARLGGTAFLLVGFGDGQLVAFALDAAGERVIVGSKKRLVLGTQSLHLVPFKTENRDCVFAASDMPTVLYAGNNNKLVCSNLNLKNVLSGCQFRLPSNPGAIALATPTSLKIGSLDNIQKLHIQKIPLQETPRRISWWEGGGFFGVLTGIVDPTSGNEQSFLRVFDNQTYECVDSFEFKVDEIPQSICSIPMSASSFTDESPESLFVVGTAILNAVSSQEEPEAGRVIAFAFDKRMRKLQLVCEIATSGCVYGLAQLEIGMVVAAVKSQVQVLQVVYDADLNIYSFVSLCSAYGFVQSIYISVRGRIVTVGDLVNTVTMLEFVPASSMDGTEARLVDVARDYLPAWTTAVHAVNDEGLVVVGEIGSNLYALRRQTEVTLEEEHRRLELVGMFHLGEFVNSIKRGSLASRAGPEHPNEMQANSMLFCTSSGTFGSIVPVKAETFQILSGLQSNMQKHIVPVGGFGHVEWRTFASDKRTHESVGFIDGDFVQQFASMDAAEMEQVFCGAKNAGVKVEADSVERVLEILEELAAVV